MYILCIYLYIHGIYMVYTVMSTYTRNILCIYMVYTWYIHGYTIHIMCICSTGRLMLRRRTGSHSTGSTSNDIAWMDNNFNLSPFLRTFGILAPGEVDAQGAPGTENSREVPCLTGKTYKPIFLALSHSSLRSGPKDK